MNKHKISLASEIKELEYLINTRPEDHFIERMSLKSRLASVREELAALPEQTSKNVENFVGRFQGVLPMGRVFEFQLSDQSGIIKGKIDKFFDNPNILNRVWLDKLVNVKLSTVIVGKGRPRYTLSSLDDITNYSNE